MKRTYSYPINNNALHPDTFHLLAVGNSRKIHAAATTYTSAGFVCYWFINWRPSPRSTASTEPDNGESESASSEQSLLWGAGPWHREFCTHALYFSLKEWGWRRRDGGTVGLAGSNTTLFKLAEVKRFFRLLEVFLGSKEFLYAVSTLRHWSSFLLKSHA